ncbi:hypothetical protein FOMPIDRAFT_1019717 [Fomitopsis schrenkii]|uniref:Uncharacterized protein n=1 Tax=Fomitopsis schrenkii TaxID=2126942 RepID=S8DNM0_FOMSC|nr:hypothetical protein FOMPIDRAFT_1019717 [Fomitopsis schrenkii]
MPASPSLRETQEAETMPSTDPDSSVDTSSAESPSDSTAGDDVPPQSESGLDTNDSPEAGATEDPPARRKRPRHPRARGGRRIQEAKARKAARIAAQEAAAAEAARLATDVEVAGATAEIETDAARILAEPGALGVEAEAACALLEAQEAHNLEEAEAARAADEAEAEAEAARAASGDEAAAAEVFEASHSASNGLEDPAESEAKKRRRRQRRNRLKANSRAVDFASASSHDQGVEVGADDAASGSAELFCERTPISDSISTSSSLGSLRILSQPPTPSLGTLRAWPSEPFMELDDDDVSEEGIADGGDALPCFDPLEDPLSSKNTGLKYMEPLEASTLAHTSSLPLSELKYGQPLADVVVGKSTQRGADAMGLRPISEFRNATCSKFHFAAAPSLFSGPLYLPNPDALDASLASNAHCGSHLAPPILRLDACPAPSPQLSQSHYALLQTLFPDGNSGTPRIHRVSEPLPPHTDNSAASSDDPADTLAHDLWVTQKEISSLKGSMATLLARMDSTRSAYASGTAAKQASRAREEARAVHVLRSLLKDMERISVLTVCLTAAVQSGNASSV